jgi:hypothetical protein
MATVSVGIMHFHVCHFGFQRHPGWAVVLLLSESLSFFYFAHCLLFKTENVLHVSEAESFSFSHTGWRDTQFELLAVANPDFLGISLLF